MSYEKSAMENVRRFARGAFLIGALSTVAACGDGTAQGHKNVSQRSGGNPHAHTGPRPASDFAWGKRVHLRRDTFGSWNAHHPEPVVKKHLSKRPKYLLVVDDGRFNYPQDPDPDTDSPTGLYSTPSQESEPVTKVRDGTVLKAVGWTNEGQYVSDAHDGQGYPIWEEVKGHDGAKAWVPWVNVGYTALRQLHQLPEPIL